MLARALARNWLRRDWVKVGPDIRLRVSVLSHWLRGRQQAMTQGQFQQRLCDPLCMFHHLLFTLVIIT